MISNFFHSLLDAMRQKDKLVSPRLSLRNGEQPSAPNQKFAQHMTEPSHCPCKDGFWPQTICSGKPSAMKPEHDLDEEQSWNIWSLVPSQTEAVQTLTLPLDELSNDPTRVWAYLFEGKVGKPSKSQAFRLWIQGTQARPVVGRAAQAVLRCHQHQIHPKWPWTMAKTHLPHRERWHEPLVSHELWVDQFSLSQMCPGISGHFCAWRSTGISTVGTVPPCSVAQWFHPTTFFRSSCPCNRVRKARFCEIGHRFMAVIPRKLQATLPRCLLARRQSSDDQLHIWQGLMQPADGKN